MNAAAMTPKQYHAAIRTAQCAKRGITPAQYDKAFPSGCHNERWAREIVAAAETGVKLSRLVVDRLCELWGEDAVIRHFRGVCEKCLPAGYLTPSRRRANMAYYIETRRALRAITA